MRSLLIALGVVVGCATFSLVLGAATERYPETDAANFTRACRFTGSNRQIVTATGSSTGSTALSGSTVYRLQCTEDVYFDQEASGGTGTATSADPTLVGDRELYFLCKQGDFMTLRAVTAAGTCDITECL
jgi:hypothetical protein